ncbi:uncharacterized protein LOC111066659 [Drosophila obscura]|uniref:uncharacterized protein LOC111066659 n=1 Tax=Drosophila obscura TaxID=7282 RepID=UPI000BA00421|nr:uncharacterized protein LOC111066659 [Drosophila obscura]
MQATIKAFNILAIALMAHQTAAGTISFGTLMGDVSKVAVIGEKAWNQLANTIGASQPKLVQSETLNILSDMATGLGNLANAITSLNVETDYVQPEVSNLLGEVLGSIGTGLGDLANAITSLSVQVKAGPQARSISSDGVSIIAEGGAVSAKTIATAADAAAPYIKKLNESLGDLANALTNL